MKSVTVTAIGGTGRDIRVRILPERATIDDYLKTARFEGPVRGEECDRLCTQLKIIYLLMIDGAWRTLGEIEFSTGDPQASISAQLRHLRKYRFGAHIVNKRRRPEKTAVGKPPGTWEYQLLERPRCGRIE